MVWDVDCLEVSEPPKRKKNEYGQEEVRGDSITCSIMLCILETIYDGKSLVIP